MLSAVANLREIAQCCSEGQPLRDHLARWLGKCLGEFLAHRVQTIEEALGLRPVRGGVPWWLEDAMRARNAALQELGRCFYISESISAQARQIYLAAMRYAGSAWRFDRERDAMPAGYEGTARALLWRAFKSGAQMPIGERQLRTILAGCARRSCAHGRRMAKAADDHSEGHAPMAQIVDAHGKL